MSIILSHLFNAGTSESARSRDYCSEQLLALQPAVRLSISDQGRGQFRCEVQAPAPSAESLAFFPPSSVVGLPSQHHMHAAYA